MYHTDTRNESKILKELTIATLEVRQISGGAIEKRPIAEKLDSAPKIISYFGSHNIISTDTYRAWEVGGVILIKDLNHYLILFTPLKK